MFFSQSFGARKYKVVEIKTKYGDIYIWLYKETPKHRNNFFKLTEAGFYDSTTFHRVIKNFMIQGGDPYSNDEAKKDSVGEGGTGYTIDAEISSEYFHKRGVIAAARMGDNVNPGRQSSGCQFYIVQGKIFTEEELLKAEKRIEDGIKKKFKLSKKAKKQYMTVGGTPWLDMQYTIFGEVVKGMDVVDKIAQSKTRPGDKPIVDIKMDINVLTMSKKEFKEKFGKKPPR